LKIAAGSACATDAAEDGIAALAWGSVGSRPDVDRVTFEILLISMILPFGCKVNLRQIDYRHVLPIRSDSFLINY